MNICKVQDNGLFETLLFIIRTWRHCKHRHKVGNCRLCAWKPADFLSVYIRCVVSHCQIVALKVIVEFEMCISLHLWEFLTRAKLSLSCLATCNHFWSLAINDLGQK